MSIKVFTTALRFASDYFSETFESRFMIREYGDTSSFKTS